MKVELDLNTNEYIKIKKELEQLNVKYKELNLEYEEICKEHNRINLESAIIMSKVDEKNNNIDQMFIDKKVKTKTITIIVIDGTIITSLVFTGLGLKFNDPMFALYGATFYIGEILATNKIIQKIETRRKNRIENNKKYLKINNEIEKLRELVKEKEDELSIIKSKKEKKENKLKEIKELIDNKNIELQYFTNKLYLKIDNILDNSLENSKQKIKIKNINENK